MRMFLTRLGYPCPWLGLQCCISILAQQEEAAREKAREEAEEVGVFKRTPLQFEEALCVRVWVCLCVCVCVCLFS